MPNPFADQPGERLYRTGDLARWLNHTEQPRLEFAGRIDRQIKLRGFRIELGEIEANLLALPGVTQALVVAHERTSLIAYLVANGSVDLADWRASLAQRLPDYMIPAHFMVLPAFPVNANGKIDRRLLPLPTADAPARASRPPANPLEEILVGIWAELLGQPQATVDTDFFNAGGNSLLAARVAARVRRHLDLAVPLRVLFENPTPAGLAEWLRNRTSSHDPRPALSATADPSAPLSYAQARLWFVQQLEPASGAYNIPLPLRLTGPLCVATLREVLGQLVARHESLRTRIAVIGEEPCQLVDPPGPPRLQLVDLSQLGEAARAAAAERLLAKEVARPFDLTRGPLMRCLLLRQTSAQHLLILNVHHIISDGRSMDILMLELGRLYAGLAEGRPPQLSELALQYRDFARWQRAWPLDWLDERLRFWVEMLAGAPPLLTLPADFSRPHRSAQAGALHRFALPPQLLQVLDRHCQQTGATRYMVLLGIYAVVLSRYADQRELCIGTPVAQREFVALERVVGFFANTLALRLSLPGEADLHQLTAHVRGVVLAALEHQDTPFDFLVERLAPKRLPGVHPLFQTSFSLETVRPGLVEPGVAVGPLRVALVEPEGQPAKFDCGLYLYQEGELLYGRLAYSAELYRPATMAAIAQTYVYLVEQWLERPDCALAELAWLDPTTRAMVLEAWNPGPRPYPREATIQSLVASWVQRQPEALALLYEQETRSWRQWWEASAGLAQALRQRGLRPGAFVAVALPRSLGLMEAILAIAQVGGVYQPIDANQPGERQRFMLAETGVQLLITHRASTVRVPGQEPLFIEDARPPAPRFDFYPGCGDDLAYIVYTSGSTGRPKGVAATHRGVVRLVHDVQYIDLSRGERTLFASTIGFDAAVLDMWSSLLNGGSLAILPTGAIDRLGYYLSAYQVTTTFMTTQLFQVLVDEDLGAFAGMRQLLVGGEALSAAHAKRFLEAHPGVAFYNVYGPTENGVLTSAVDLRRVPMLANGAPLGTAIDRSTLYVVDQRLQLLPLGAYGELVTGGDGLAQGYFQRPALTAEKFVPNPFAGVPGARMYRTGDLVRWVRLEQGPVFEFAGRIDRQVKLRGFRIEIGEIEHAIGRLTGVAQALVLLSHAHGDARLIAYAVPHAGFQLQPERLLSELAQRLPPYMMPSALVVLEQFPMNANGKIDRARLPEPSGAAANVEEALTPRQAWLRDLWQELLGAESIGLKDNFFILGGHSLLATRLVARVRARLGVALSLHEVFTYSDLDAMAAVIERASAATSNEAPALMAESQCALSFSQQRLWFLDQLTPGDPTYHIALRLRWRGDLDVVRLERALYLLVERHEALRTAFPATAEGPSQRIEAPVSPPVGLCDLSLLDEAEQARLLAELAGRAARAPFALERAPLFRWTLVRGAAGEHWLLFTLHHIIADGWSLQILMREWVEAYDALGRGQLPSWPALPLRYRDYALRQRAELVGEALRERESFWSAYLAAPLPSLDMPTDWPRPSLQSSAGALLTLPFPPALEQALGTFRRQGGATVYQTLLAALVALLRRHSGQGEFLVATPVANRPQAELEGLVGFFVNTLIVRVAVGEGDSFDRLVAKTVASCQAAFAHQDFPFERLVALLQPERDLSRAPLAQVMFQVLEQDSFEAATPARLEFWDPLENPAQLDLSFAVRGQEDGYKLYLTYATALFSAASARRLATRFLDLAAALLAQPQLPVDRVALIDPAERALLQAFNATDDAFDQSATIHGLFVAQARRRPTAIAVTHGLTRLDYKTLLARAQANAARLRAHGVVREQPVGVCLQRNEDLIVALLAVLLAGGAYVPIDPAYPEQRKRHMLEDSGARVVLTDPRERANLPNTLERLTVSHENLDNLADAACLPDQLAYIIYTSGSTGRPKGVAIRHLNACALCHWSQRAFSEAEMAVVLASTSVCFDLSVFEIFATLARGCRAVVVENLLHLVEAPAADEITLINTVPSAMTELLRLGVPESVTTVNLAGEPFQASLIQALYGLPHVKAVHNLYGPSEDTTYSTGTLLPRDLSGTASIGGPILNTQLHLLDRFGAPVPYGVAGEIHLGGLGLARGYHRRPALTAEKFVPDPFGASPGGRLYRTGDLARFRVDGALLFLGRLDHQVKIRGFRIELGEIEARISALPVVERSLVTHHQDARGSVQLVAYVQPRKGLAPPTEERLLRYLESQLPEYMVPNAIVFLDFPLTPNGKIDRQRLPAPAQAGMAVPPPSTMQTIASLQGEILRAPLAEGDRRRMLELLQQLANPAERASTDALEAQLLQIWREVLGLVHIDRNDNFFKLGGHSLLAVRVLAQIAAQLDVRLPLVSFFQATTVSQLAELMRRQVGGGDQCLQCLRAEGRRPPLYLVHPAGGGLLGYHALVQALVDRPVYGFVAQGFEGQGQPLEDFEALAQRYVEELLAHQPQGPHLLAGWSLGGVLASAMVARLQALGQPTLPPLLFDAHAPLPRFKQAFDGSEAQCMGYFLFDLAGQAGVALAADAAQLELLRREDARQAGYRWAQRHGLLGGDLSEREFNRLYAVFRANLLALLAYQPSPRPDTVLLFKAQASAREQGDQLGWEQLFASVRTHEVPGDHFSLLTAPMLEHWISLLEHCLAQLQHHSGFE